jgi:hypothetical protein
VLTIEKKALNFAQQNHGNFVVKTISASGGCCDVSVKDISIEFIKDFKSNNNYICYEYEGVKIFIEKGLQLDADILIYQKLKLPLIGNIFGTKGISVKYI